jgi:tryptophan-rich hypothetical protein
MRIQRRFLLRSRWTSIVPLEGGERHVEIIDVRDADVIARAVLTRRDYSVAISSLEDPSAWTSGWQQLPGISPRPRGRSTPS